jgi:hypothetical protein
MLTHDQQLAILADPAAHNGEHPGIDPSILDPGDFAPGELCMAVELARLGKHVRDEILPYLSADVAALLTMRDPDAPPHEFSTWADLISALGPIRWEWPEWLPAEV